MNLKIEQFTLHSADQTELFAQRQRPAGEMVGSIAVCHGLGEYSDRYHHLSKFFSAQGYLVSAVDLRGHGRSNGPRGHIDTFQNYLDDVRALIDDTHQQAPDVPCYLLGHSMGGVISLNYAIHYPKTIAGVIVSAPGLVARMAVPGWKLNAGRILSSLWPTLAMSNGIGAEGLSHDQAAVDAYQNDHLVHDKVTARWSTEFFGACEWTLAHAADLEIPALLLHGNDDPIVDPAGTRQFHDNIGHQHKLLHIYDGLYHEIFNEPEHPDIFNDILNWLQTQ